jgi:hypothetical protein
MLSTSERSQAEVKNLNTLEQSTRNLFSFKAQFLFTDIVIPHRNRSHISFSGGKKSAPFE